MICDSLFLTRTTRQDYRWIRRPDYADDSLESMLRPLFIMIEDQKNEAFFREEGKYNLYFFVGKEYCVLCYLYFTERTDMVGRRIYALEGITCRKKDSALLWKNIPFLIWNMCGTGKGLEFYSQEVKMLQNIEDFPALIQIPESEEMLSMSVEQLLSQFQRNKSVFLNLIEEMHYADRMYSFVFGTREKSFYLPDTERQYWIGEERRVCCPPTEKKAMFIGEEICDVKYFFSGGMTGYYLSVLAVTEDNELAAGFENAVHFDKKGISIAALFFMQERVERILEKYGYRIRGDVDEAVKCDKEFFPYMKMEKSGYPFPLYFVKVAMSDRDGEAGRFKNPEHKLIRQLFQYTKRIEQEYYARFDGRDTVYILNMNSGLWMFSFIRDNQNYRLEGMMVDAENAKTGWIFAEKLINQYLLGNRAYDSAFMDVYNDFWKEAATMLQPASCIVSTVSEKNFPKMQNVRVYTIPGKEKTFSGELEKEQIKLPVSDYKWGALGKFQEYYIVPPLLLGRTWYFTYRRVKRGSEEWTRIPLKSIKNGNCDVCELFREVTKCFNSHCQL